MSSSISLLFVHDEINVTRLAVDSKLVFLSFNDCWKLNLLMVIDSQDIKWQMKTFYNLNVAHHSAAGRSLHPSISVSWSETSSVNLNCCFLFVCLLSSCITVSFQSKTTILVPFPTGSVHLNKLILSLSPVPQGDVVYWEKCGQTGSPGQTGSSGHGAGKEPLSLQGLT